MLNKKNPAAGRTAHGADKQSVSATKHAKDNAAPPEIQLLDCVPNVISRPLQLIDSRAYAVTSLPVMSKGKRTQKPRASRPLPLS